MSQELYAMIINCLIEYGPNVIIAIFNLIMVFLVYKKRVYMLKAKDLGLSDEELEEIEVVLPDERILSIKDVEFQKRIKRK